MTAVLELENVSYTYSTGAGPVPALCGLNLLIPRASSTAIVGRSGSGKSTLVGILSLLRRPTEGVVRLDGSPVASLPDKQLAALRGRHLGVVFQSFHLESSATAVENITLSAYFNGGISMRVARARARDLLELLGIPELASRRPPQMSGGQRQRVAIARALLAAPGIVLADEPTGNLDEQTAESIAAVLLGLPAQTGTAVVIVTHDHEIAALADRTVTLAGGQIASAARP